MQFAYSIIIQLFCAVMSTLTVHGDANYGETRHGLQFCPASCRLPLLSFGQTKYYFHTSSKLTWMEAYGMCEANGLHLLSIETAEEDFLITKAISGSAEVFWTSGNDIQNEKGNFTWQSTSEQFNYTGAWAVGQPQRGVGYDHCVFVGQYGGSDQINWYDAPCMWRHYFICEN